MAERGVELDNSILQRREAEEVTPLLPDSPSDARREGPTRRDLISRDAASGHSMNSSVVTGRQRETEGISELSQRLSLRAEVSLKTILGPHRI